MNVRGRPDSRLVARAARAAGGGGAEMKTLNAPTNANTEAATRLVDREARINARLRRGGVGLPDANRVSCSRPCRLSNRTATRHTPTERRRGEHGSHSHTSTRLACPPGCRSTSETLTRQLCRLRLPPGPLRRRDSHPAHRPEPGARSDSGARLIPHHLRRPVEFVGAEQECLHAKVVVDGGRHVFVISANLAEAARHRNIEVGFALDSAPTAQSYLASSTSLSPPTSSSPTLMRTVNPFRCVPKHPATHLFPAAPTWHGERGSRPTPHPRHLDRKLPSLLGADRGRGPWRRQRFKPPGTVTRAESLLKAPRAVCENPTYGNFRP